MVLMAACSRATPTPVPTDAVAPMSSPSPTPAPAPGAILAPPDRDLYSLAQRLRLKSPQAIPRVVNPEPVSYQEGHRGQFTITDLVGLKTRTAMATLQVVSEHAYWYVEDGLDISTGDMRDASQIFEDSIHPSVTGLFGNIWVPGVDNDPHLLILHVEIPGLAGYYSSADEYPKEVHSKSNEGEIIYMDGKNMRVGSTAYLGTLAHEFQHAVHWNADPNEESWVNEGLSEVASDRASYKAAFIDRYLKNPNASLTLWPDDPRATPPHYGGASLFFFYLAQHYGGYESLKGLVMEPEDSIDGVNAYLANLGYEETFLDVFRDWVVANYLDAPEGPYSYPDRIVQAQVRKYITDYRQMEGHVPQFGAEYINLRLDDGDARVTFEGASQVQVLPTQPYSGDFCWWSNRGDAIDSTLTRSFDLSDLGQATLQFWTWYDVEKSWDYGYIEVSTDGGQTWDIVEGKSTSQANPIGNSFGHGLTGKSDGWTQESVDLTPYAGKDVLLRFEYITDDAVNRPGLCIDDISISQLDYFHDAESDGGWEARGFVRIDNTLPQTYIVQVIENGTEHPVRHVTLDTQQRGAIVIRGFGSSIEDAVLVISPTTDHTSQDAPYKVTIQRVE